mgnify:CR=1 FL=1
MQEELVTLETAKLAKEKGFDVPVWDYFQVTCSKQPSECHRPTKSNWNTYNEYEVYSRPSQSLLQRWLREVHNIRVLVDFETIDDSTTDYTYKIVRDIPEGKGRKKDTWDFYETTYSFNQGGGWYKTYEEALEIGLQESLKQIKTSHL